MVWVAFLEMGKDEDRGRWNKKADGVRALPRCTWIMLGDLIKSHLIILLAPDFWVPNIIQITCRDRKEKWRAGRLFMKKRLRSWVCADVVTRDPTETDYCGGDQRRVKLPHGYLSITLQFMAPNPVDLNFSSFLEYECHL